MKHASEGSSNTADCVSVGDGRQWISTAASAGLQKRAGGARGKGSAPAMNAGGCAVSNGESATAIDPPRGVLVGVEGIARRAMN